MYISVLRMQFSDLQKNIRISISALQDLIALQSQIPTCTINYY